MKNVPNSDIITLTHKGSALSVHLRTVSSHEYRNILSQMISSESEAIVIINRCEINYCELPANQIDLK